MAVKGKIAQSYKAFKENLTNYKKLNFLHDQVYNDYKSPKVNLGQMQAAHNRERKNIAALSEVEFQVFSQFGDDGIIQWLVNQLPIPNKTFIEFGVENYREANTRFLLINNYWSGLVIDGSRSNIRAIEQEQLYTFYDLQAECSFITRENINAIIAKAGFKNDTGILSIDIDGNDYWVWKAIDTIMPIIIICEYNCLFGFEQPHTIAYKENFVRGTDYPMNFYGTSLRSAYDLGAEKGYGFIGCNSAGNNAYFIRNDYLKYLLIPTITPKQGYRFSSFTEAWDTNGKPLRGIEKIRSIDNLPVVNTGTGNIEKVHADAIIDMLAKNNCITRY